MKEEAPPPPPPGPVAPMKPRKLPKLPKGAPPPVPENKYPWSEKIFLDELLSRGTYGANVTSRVIGRAGIHHSRMEAESGARVFFRGLGVSGRETELKEAMDCRLHIMVKGTDPKQGKKVRKILSEIIAEVDKEVEDRREQGPALDRPKDATMHPFGFMLPDSLKHEEDNLKFKFPEEEGQTLNDMLVWLKQTKLPLELDSDTQWRTTLQITPTEPLPADEPVESAQEILAVFQDLINNWYYPAPYCFEESELQPVGLWSSMAQDLEGTSSLGAVTLQDHQIVKLSGGGAERFATLMVKSSLVDAPK